MAQDRILSHPDDKAFAEALAVSGPPVQSLRFGGQVTVSREQYISKEEILASYDDEAGAATIVDRDLERQAPLERAEPRCGTE